MRVQIETSDSGDEWKVSVFTKVNGREIETGGASGDMYYNGELDLLSLLWCINEEIRAAELLEE